MKQLTGTIIASGLLLALSSPSHAQVNVQFGRGGTPSVSFGQPAYGQYRYAGAQPTYGPTYARPSYYSQSGPVYTPRTYSSGYSGYYTAPTYRPGYTQPTYVSPVYQTSYRQQPYYNSWPYAQGTSGPGVIVNGRRYALPR